MTYLTIVDEDLVALYIVTCELTAELVLAEWCVRRWIDEGELHDLPTSVEAIIAMYFSTHDETYEIYVDDIVHVVGYAEAEHAFVDACYAYDGPWRRDCG